MVAIIGQAGVPVSPFSDVESPPYCFAALSRRGAPVPLRGATPDRVQVDIWKREPKARRGLAGLIEDERVVVTIRTGQMDAGRRDRAFRTRAVSDRE